MSESLERSMTGIWQDVLGMDGIGLADNFFELGGNSILASSLAERVARTFDLDLAFDEVFEHQTIAELCECVRSRQHAGEFLNRTR